MSSEIVDSIDFEVMHMRTAMGFSGKNREVSGDALDVFTRGFANRLQAEAPQYTENLKTVSLPETWEDVLKQEVLEHVGPELQERVEAERQAGYDWAYHSDDERAALEERNINIEVEYEYYWDYEEDEQAPRPGWPEDKRDCKYRSRARSEAEVSLLNLKPKMRTVDTLALHYHICPYHDTAYPDDTRHGEFLNIGSEWKNLTVPGLHSTFSFQTKRFWREVKKKAGEGLQPELWKIMQSDDTDYENKTMLALSIHMYGIRGETVNLEPERRYKHWQAAFAASMCRKVSEQAYESIPRKAIVVRLCPHIPVESPKETPKIKIPLGG